MTPMHRRLLLAAVPAAALAAPAAAQTAVTLFQVVGPGGNVLIGVTAQELAGWGRGEPVSVVAERLVATGTITVWQYAVGRAADGTLQMQPRARIALLRNDAVRIEPYAAAHPVAAPAP